MKKACRHIILASLLLCTSATPAVAAGGVWEPLKIERQDAKSVVKEQDLEIKTAPSCIIISSQAPVHIKVFTILGRLVSSETLPAGVSQLSVGAHGVYIIKVGELTCKVAI